jgi:hypothetical protein
MGRRLDVYLRDGEIEDVRLDGESQWPSWFKIEWKENGQRSAKIRGERLSTNFGDEIVIHQADAAAPVPRASARARRSAALPTADTRPATQRRESDQAIAAEAPELGTSLLEPPVPELTE